MMMKIKTKTRHFDDDDDENNQVISKLLTIVFCRSKLKDLITFWWSV